jgi:hypothetical protein
MYILSAKHHLVPLTKELAPYDMTLKDMKKDEKEKWGQVVVDQMKQAGINPKCCRPKGLSIQYFSKKYFHKFLFTRPLFPSIKDR